MPIWIQTAHRSFLGKYKGALSTLRADDLTTQVLNQHIHFKPEAVYLGCANQAGEDARNIARLAVLLSDLPEETPAVTLNSLCGSSTHALEYAWLQLKMKRHQTLWAGGIEQMTRSPLACLPLHIEPNAPWQDTTFGWRFKHPDFEDTVAGRSMLDHADCLAEGLAPEDLDTVVLQSHQRAFQSLSVTEQECLTLVDAKGHLLLNKDECVRPHLNRETLERLKPIRELGIHTPAQVAPYADGAAGMVLSLRHEPFAQEMYEDSIGIELVDILQTATSPNQMPLAGLDALTTLIKKHDLPLEKVACFELHEAFASAYLLQCQALGLNAFSDDRINATGSSFALGSPMGATALRSVCTLAHRLRREGSLTHPYGIATISIGMGLGSVVLLKRLPL